MTDLRSSLSPAEARARISAAITAGDVDTAAELIGTFVWVLLFDDPIAMRELIGRLPASVLQSRPALAMVASFAAPLALVPSRGLGAPLVPPAVDMDALTPGERDWYLMALVVVHRLRSEFREAREVAARVRPRLRRPTEQQSRVLREFLPGYFAQLGAAELLGGDIDQALADFDEAATLDPVDSSDTFVRDALIRAAIVHAVEGSTHEAERLLAAAHTYPERADRYGERTAARELLARALLAVERLDPDAGDLVDASEAHADDELWPLRLLLRARWERAHGNHGGVLELVSRARSAHPVPAGSLAEQVVHHDHVVALVLMDVAEQARGDLEGDPSRLAPLPAIARVRLMLHLDDPAAALQAARRLAARDRLGPTFRAEALLLAAWAHELLTGEVHEGYARAAGALIAQERLWRVLGLVPPPLRAATGAVPPADAAELLASALVPLPEATVHVTTREREVLRALSAGGSLPEIAHRLHVSVNTVKSQARSAYRRLGVNSRAAAVTEASRRGLLSP
ncbi:LuxR C-terminal-related transcriptional regulator [Microbacterium sp. X-17]|uniref:helix-turn-helix transcriptional regulator n=1 Tax=Microbacterium sp. X-17 TaxID=3144404 RepID=UPI0031F50801